MDLENEKKIVGEKAAEFVKDGMIVGLGTGSTVFYTIKKLGQLVNEGLSIKAVPTSIQTERLAREVGITLVDFTEIEEFDLVIDGADEVDENLDLIKGGGGALLREKVIAYAAREFIVVADSSKLVNRLGAFKLPVEVVPFGMELTEKHLKALGGLPRLRTSSGTPFKTDNGNFIFDCDFGLIENVKELEYKINMIPGVVENGLFVGMADKVITVDKQGEVVIRG
ncbi:ribose-5-phosphate isomerase RpiA [Bacillus sp. FJAT-18017]|uniref:ribose-5-phosphate isomerase RpiA n=1 Tax=Bacillus sp. FJAT-18017 TaxID=1705566 RepID=UPI0012E3224F|nr:ribose-5-phosphate isomerase RpiA [Bacillus sp. FJAT-18017]